MAWDISREGLTGKRRPSQAGDYEHDDDDDGDADTGTPTMAGLL